MSTNVASTGAQAPPLSRGLNIFLWVLQVLSAGMFLMAATGKLSGSAAMVGLFQAIGWGQWFRYVTGGIELVSAIFLLIPRLATIGGALLVCTMIGAIITHVTVLHSSPAIPIVLLLTSGIVAWYRRPLLRK